MYSTTGENHSEKEFIRSRIFNGLEGGSGVSIKSVELPLSMRSFTDRQEVKRIFLRHRVKRQGVDAVMDTSSSWETNNGVESVCVPSPKSLILKCRDFSDGKEAK
jgi:hypothetical protein